MTVSKSEAPEDCAALVEHAIAEQRAGRHQVAERLYAAALHVCPDHPEAHHNLAILLMQSGNRGAALEHFKLALENDADRELYWLSFGRALLLDGHAPDAVAVLQEGGAHLPDDGNIAELLKQALAMSGGSILEAPSFDLDSLAAEQARALASRGQLPAAVRRLRNAIRARPAHADALQLQLGDVLAESGDIAGAISTFEEALARNPHFSEAHHHLGSILSENGEVQRGFAHLMQRATLVHASHNEDRSGELAHKVKHDQEQHAYLVGSGILQDGDPLRLHIADGRRQDGPAVNPANAGEDLKERWDRASPRFLVFDQFLVPDALEQLRSYCAASTVWKRVYNAGYIGATPEDGFACPLLAQIVEEIQEVYQPILKAQPFRYLGAFKYDSELSTGTNTHADFSAINVNLYITPDDANLAADRGGMVIWDASAQSEEELRYYNGHEQELGALLQRGGAKAHHIPHRANRAVIFASNLFHKTDDCSFKEGYLNKRINVSFLYGDWQTL